MMKGRHLEQAGVGLIMKGSTSLRRFCWLQVDFSHGHCPVAHFDARGRSPSVVRDEWLRGGAHGSEWGDHTLSAVSLRWSGLADWLEDETSGRRFMNALRGLAVLLVFQAMVIVVSTWMGMAVTALLLNLLLRRQTRRKQPGE
jgi:hypothetical protein